MKYMGRVNWLLLYPLRQLKIEMNWLLKKMLKVVNVVNIFTSILSSHAVSWAFWVIFNMKIFSVIISFGSVFESIPNSVIWLDSINNPIESFIFTCYTKPSSSESFQCFEAGAFLAVCTNIHITQFGEVWTFFGILVKWFDVTLRLEAVQYCGTQEFHEVIPRWSFRHKTLHVCWFCLYDSLTGYTHVWSITIKVPL